MAKDERRRDAVAPQQAGPSSADTVT